MALKHPIVSSWNVQKDVIRWAPTISDLYISPCFPESFCRTKHIHVYWFVIYNKITTLSTCRVSPTMSFDDNGVGGPWELNIWTMSSDSPQHTIISGYLKLWHLFRWVRWPYTKCLWCALERPVLCKHYITVQGILWDFVELKSDELHVNSTRCQLHFSVMA